ncbi:hypothetical protein, partial [Burkholderia sp. LMG 13014]|uniref:hypothetical protein n=1 Tax=Burkholderia sp. LMG 13014 TaxID=2709306 RepID=UPI0019654DC2
MSTTGFEDASVASVGGSLAFRKRVASRGERGGEPVARERVCGVGRIGQRLAHECPADLAFCASRAAQCRRALLQEHVAREIREAADRMLG